MLGIISGGASDDEEAFVFVDDNRVIGTRDDISFILLVYAEREIASLLPALINEIEIRNRMIELHFH